jgi:anti-sigma B factor antagonist
VSVLDVRVTTTRMGASAYAVAVSGELDLPSAGHVQQRLAELIEDDARTIVVDLMGVNFIDSAGLGVLLSATKALRSNGGELVLAADDRRILRLLEITGLDRSMRVEPSFVEAVDYVVQRRRVD